MTDSRSEAGKGQDNLGPFMPENNNLHGDERMKGHTIRLKHPA